MKTNTGGRVPRRDVTVFNADGITPLALGFYQAIVQTVSTSLSTA